MMLLWKIFLVFTRVSLFSWGGGPASLALMQRETTAQGWVTPPEFADAVAVGNALPGPIAPQVSAFVGYKLAGVPGAVAAAGGHRPAGDAADAGDGRDVLRRQGQPGRPGDAEGGPAGRDRAAGSGRPTTWRSRSSAVRESGSEALLVREWDKILIAVAAFALLTFTKVNPAVIILGAAALGFGVYR